MRRRTIVILALVCVAVIAYCLRRPLLGRESYIPPQEWVEKKLGSPDTVEWNGRTYPRSGDEVWSFSSPPESWKQLMGTGGVCLIRNGKVIDGYVTHVN